jgi:hypothetical protein
MTDAAPAGHTPAVNIRVPRQLWEAYGRCTARINGGRDRTEDLTRHMARVIELLGSEQDKADLASALEELEARRSRKGGRPRRDQAAQAAADAPEADQLAHAGPVADAGGGIVVIGCGARKLDRPAAARDLYTGAYFRSCLAAALAVVPADRVLVLSAKHGLLPLDQVIDPYDVQLSDPDAVTADDVATDAGMLGVADRPVTALCSARYAALARLVWDDATTPLAGLGIGYQRAVLAAMRDQGTVMPALPRALGYDAGFREDD